MAQISDGDGAIGRGSGRPDGDVGGDAALAARPLRSGNAEGGRRNPIRLIIVLTTEAALVFVLIATVDGELAVIVIVAADPTQN